MFGKPTSDPFVIIKFGGGIGNTQKLLSKSEVVKKNLNPRQVNVPQRNARPSVRPSLTFPLWVCFTFFLSLSLPKADGETLPESSREFPSLKPRMSRLTSMTTTNILSQTLWATSHCSRRTSWVWGQVRETVISSRRKRRWWWW